MRDVFWRCVVWITTWENYKQLLLGTFLIVSMGSRFFAKERPSYAYGGSPRTFASEIECWRALTVARLRKQTTDQACTRR